MTTPGLFLFKIVLEEFHGGRTETTCAIVYNDSRYRLEKTTLDYPGGTQAKIYESSLLPGSLQELQQILDAPGLKSADHRNLPTEYRPIREGWITTLTIPRPGGPQNLAFSSYFGTRGSIGEVGSESNLQYGVGNNTQLVKPLRKWIKTNLEERKIAPLPNAPLTRCAPSQP